MRHAPLPVFLVLLLLTSLGLAQTTQPTTKPTTQPAADRKTPLGTFVLFDSTVADLGVEKAMAFYHCTTDAQRRYVRAECEYYVAVNKLVRAVEKRFGKTVAGQVREECGDSIDYSEAVVREEGDSAAMVRPGQDPFPLIRLNEQWHFSMPDLFEIQGEARLMEQRPTFEGLADRINALRERIESGTLRTQAALLREAGELREDRDF